MRSLRILLLIPSLMLLTHRPITAQERPDAFSGSSLGFQIQQVQPDFGVGGHFTTPYFRHVLALRLGVSVQWLGHIPEGETNSTWDPYLQARIGIVSRNVVVPERVSIYGEGGLLVLRPNENFSEDRIRMGGYGLFGVEFHLHETLGQFLEIGGAGTGARAELSEGAPIHSNGLIVSAGMRFYW